MSTSARCVAEVRLHSLRPARSSASSTSASDATADCATTPLRIARVDGDAARRPCACPRRPRPAPGPPARRRTPPARRVSCARTGARRSSRIGSFLNGVSSHRRCHRARRRGEQLLQRHAARLLVEERLVGGVLQQPPHEIRHAGHEVADGAIRANAQALGGDRGLQRVAQPAQDLQLEVAVAAAGEPVVGDRVGDASAGCATRSPRGPSAARRAAAASAARSSRRCRPCARTPAATSRAARPGRARGPSRRP